MNRFITLETKRKSVERLITSSLDIDINTLNDALQGTLEQLLVSSLNLSIDHVVLQHVTQLAIELVNIMLFVSFTHAPTKCL